MNNVTFVECKFSGDIVPYMYGELSVDDCSAFEAHLLGCEKCTDEFASISNARYEVYDWKKLEFDPLETPQVEIPYGEVSAVSTASAWIAKVRTAFAAGWAGPAIAFGCLAIVSIFGAVFLTAGSRDGDVASRFDNSNIAKVETSSATNTVEITATEREPEGDVRNGAGPVRTSTPVRVQQRHPVRNVRLIQSRQVEAKQALTRPSQKAVPTLNEFAEDEDKSLRLAELFDDIETRD